MAVREILILPDPLLRKVAEPVEAFDEDLQKTVDDMFETMYDAPGIGLAGPQIGYMKRVVVIDLADEENPDSGKIAMVNPEIVGLSEQTAVSEEGCLSIPELYYEVERPAEVTVKYFTPQGEEITRHATGRLAVCMQHEIDHLDGVLYIDYLSRLKRDRVNKKFQKKARLAS
ncbi:peptide deformylase [Pelagibacterium flavum]|uniref:Peptide deformylase n=1 Tax=Pelagibacterium flavum TaxID=2984530 RepID=A0ABY6IMJ3_9HYPH|nr:peptide deformylase [Pelagibacterium sp. YIM 151497]MAN76280.1 peptide deformylase [Hyphomicrobiales bacterium]UYQ71822.1 peptide deformylase [Pelagibacterium sp. YIM 151497]|tara:strand:+ start:5680 stop:6195 length:516 start_codon:yes stop_codon:yes gene_type:complete